MNSENRSSPLILSVKLMNKGFQFTECTILLCDGMTTAHHITSMTGTYSLHARFLLVTPVNLLVIRIKQ